MEFYWIYSGDFPQKPSCAMAMSGSTARVLQAAEEDSEVPLELAPWLGLVSVQCVSCVPKMNKTELYASMCINDHKCFLLGQLYVYIFACLYISTYIRMYPCMFLCMRVFASICQVVEAVMYFQEHKICPGNVLLYAWVNIWRFFMIIWS